MIMAPDRNYKLLILIARFCFIDRSDKTLEDVIFKLVPKLKESKTLHHEACSYSFETISLFLKLVIANLIIIASLVFR